MQHVSESECGKCGVWEKWHTKMWNEKICNVTQQNNMKRTVNNNNNGATIKSASFTGVHNGEKPPAHPLERRINLCPPFPPHGQCKRTNQQQCFALVRPCSSVFRLAGASSGTRHVHRSDMGAVMMRTRQQGQVNEWQASAMNEQMKWRGTQWSSVWSGKEMHEWVHEENREQVHQERKKNNTDINENANHENAKLQWGTVSAEWWTASTSQWVCVEPKRGNENGRNEPKAMRASTRSACVCCHTQLWQWQLFWDPVAGVASHHCTVDANGENCRCKRRKCLVKEPTQMNFMSWRLNWFEVFISWQVKFAGVKRFLCESVCFPQQECVGLIGVLKRVKLSCSVEWQTDWVSKQVGKKFGEDLEKLEKNWRNVASTCVQARFCWEMLELFRSSLHGN